MDPTARDEYIAAIDPVFAPAVVALDAAIASVRDDFGTRLAYGILLYTLENDFRHWVCAIDCGRPGAAKKIVKVRFLDGVLMDDPRRVLRAGKGPMRTIDFPSPDAVDPRLVAEYLRECLAKYDAFKAEAAEPKA